MISCCVRKIYCLSGRVKKNIEHNNGNDDEPQCDMTMTYIMTMFIIIHDLDNDCDYMTINLGQGHGNNCELDHLQGE